MSDDLVMHNMGNGLRSPCGLEPASVYYGFQGGFTTDWAEVNCPDCLGLQPRKVEPLPYAVDFPSYCNTCGAEGGRHTYHCHNDR